VLLLLPLIPAVNAVTLGPVNLLADGETEPVEAPLTDLVCDRAIRRLKIGAWGMIEVSDEIHVSNPTSTSIDSVTISLPFGSQNVTASDIAGPIEVFLPSRGEDTPPRAITYFRIVLKENENYTFTLHFKIPSNKRIETLEFDLYGLDFPMVPGIGTSIGVLRLEVILPEGASFEEGSVSPPPVDIEKEALHQRALFEIKDADFEDNLTLTLWYHYLIVWSAFRPTLWIGLTLALILTARRLIRIGRFEVQQDEIPRDLIRSFVSAMDEKIALQAELSSLKERVDSGSISKRQYRGRGRRIRRQLSSLKKELDELKGELRDSKDKYAETLRRIEVAEVDIETNQNNLIRLEQRYRRGRVSRGVYDRLSEEFIDRIEAAKAEVNRAVIELRGEIR